MPKSLKNESFKKTQESAKFLRNIRKFLSSMRFYNLFPNMYQHTGSIFFAVYTLVMATSPFTNLSVL